MRAALAATGQQLGAEPTHVLVWIPPWMITERQYRDCGGFWDLQTIGDFDHGRVREDSPSEWLAWDTHPVVLAAWAGSELGCPVWIELAWQRIGRPVPWRRNPVHWVRPGEWASW